MHSILDTKERVAQQVTVDVVIPRLWCLRPLLGPLCAHEVYKCKVVQVQALELVCSVRCHEVDLDRMSAQPNAQGAYATEHAMAEDLDIGRLVVLVGVPH
jgi:hypothetical protein